MNVKSLLLREHSILPLRPYEAVLAALGFAVFGSLLPWWSLIIPAFAMGFICGPRLKWANASRSAQASTSWKNSSSITNSSNTVKDSSILRNWRVQRLPTSVGVGLVASLTWLIPAIVHDIVSGGRVSTRLAMVLGLPSALFIYLFTMTIAFIVAGLGAQVGVSLRRLMQPLLPEFMRL